MSTSGTYQIQEDDILLVAYPKSGNNFLLFLVSMLLHRKKIDWATKGDMVQNVLDYPIESLPSPHLVWSHEFYDSAYPKVIYLVRDPRDVVISYYYHYVKYYNDTREFNEFFTAFLEGKTLSGMWDTHVEGWLDNQVNVKNGFMLIKYEDLLENTFKEAQRIVDFLSLDRTDQEIIEAVNWASFDNMKSLEKQQQKHLDGNSPLVNHNMSFVREGKANKWKSVLSEAQQQYIKLKFHKTLTRLGYDI